MCRRVLWSTSTMVRSEKLAKFTRNFFPAAVTLLDLMSSWRSHLPVDARPWRVVGLGLNRAEMEDNPRSRKRSFTMSIATRGSLLKMHNSMARS